LEKAGYAVISASRRLPTASSAPTGITTHQLDVTDADSVAALERAVAEHPVPLTLLVNNAGIPTHAATIADSEITDWQGTYETNVVGAVRTTQALLPHLIAHHGHAVFIGSTSAASPTSAAPPTPPASTRCPPWCRRCAWS
jgi:NADP-dependent 3-hydroxy acid dehydrogenase YdfG